MHNYEGAMIAKSKFYFSIFFAIILLFLPAVSFSTVSQFTNSSSDDQMASIYNGKIAWRSNKDGTQDIYYFDGNTTQRLTNDSASDNDPSLYNGTIAWASDVDGDYEIYYWDGNEIRQITDNTANDSHPSLYNGTIAWASDVDGDYEIYYWDGNEIHQITDNTAYESGPSLYNGSIAYHSNEDGDYEIFFWDGNTHQKITDNAVYDASPSLYNDTIAWTGRRDNIDSSQLNEIWYWDGGVPQLITNNATSDAGPSLFNGTMAWSRKADDGSYTYALYYWDGTNTHQITDYNYKNILHTSLYNETIVWTGTVNLQNNIYKYEPNKDPIAEIGCDKSIIVCQNFTLDGSLSSDSDGNIVSWDWQLEYQGDSSKNHSTTGEIAIMENLDIGTYSITLSITDNEGGIGSDTMNLDVAPIWQDWDIDNDCQRGLPEVISILQELTGQ